MRAWLRIAALYVVVSAAQAATPEGIPAGQLPRNAEPLHYSLALTLDPQREDYDGDVTIRVRLHAASDHLWLHGRGLKISSVSWQDAAGVQGGVAQYQQLNPDGVARVDFGRKLDAQDIELHFVYKADFSRSLESIYKVTRDQASYLVTQFEDIAARKAFPGFDEPSFKTPYDITLTVPENMGALANTPQISDERSESDMRTLRFATTEPLPTYLVAFAVGPWDVSRTVLVPANEVRKTRFPLRVLGPRGSKASLAHALTTTPPMVAELERYFGIPYPFSKLDLLAAPDFAFGAMENAGLITFREVLLLLDDKASAKSLQDHFEVNVHELAHQWFGDYVTLQWWDDIWLNEAFATWMETKIMDRLRPEYRAGLAQLDSILGAMQNDSLVSARRIREPILETGDINDAFDSITYQKGSGVLAMFENWLGEEKFREGIRLFMRRHARATATSDDLIAALTEASGRGQELAQAMRSFLDQPGIPLITTRLSCSGGKARMSLRQSRYLPLGSDGKQGARWKVPVCLKLGKGLGESATSAQQCMLLEQPEQSYELETCPDWYLPNAGAAGYYRYRMPSADLAKLSEQTAQLTPAEQIIHADAISAGFHRGDLGPQAVLQAMPQFATSPFPKVALFLLEDFNWILEYLADVPGAAALRRYAIALYQPQLERLGYTARPGESQDDTLLRQALAEFLALDLHSAPVRAAMLAASQPLAQAANDGGLNLDAADPNTLGTVLAVRVQEGGEAITQRLMENLKVNHNPQQRTALIEALGAAHDPQLAARVRDQVLNDGLQMRELSTFYRAHKQRPQNRAEFWGWMQANFERVIAPYPSFAQSRIPALAAGGMCTQKEAAELRKFFKPRLTSIAGGKRALNQALESVQLCTALRSASARKAFQDWVKAQSMPVETVTLMDTVASPRRSPAFRTRDLYRHPQQTLEFFGLTPQMTVAEVWPGGGWYTEILAPFLRGRGQYIAAGFVTSWNDAPEWRKDAMKDFRNKLVASPELYAGSAVGELGLPDRWTTAPANTADMVLTFRNIHNWIAGGYEHEMFQSFHAALKPGGILGVVEHRAAPGTTLEQMKLSGYVTEAYVIQLATDAGFELLEKSEINANPLDSKDYAKGVWTLPPALRLEAEGREKYLAIGESDRMTLKFVKR